VLDLGFACTGIRAAHDTAGPALVVSLRITETSGAAVEAIALRCQLRIEPAQRRYSPDETNRLLDLFGPRADWGSTLHAIQLASVPHLVPAFTGVVDTDFTLPFSYDVEVAAGKYFASLADGEIPLALLFSGTVFLAGPKGFTVEPVPWHLDARYRLPVATWRNAIDAHFPNRGWIALRRDTIDTLRAYAAAEAIVDHDALVERLLKEAGWPRL
jgi:hypothetical protein